MSEIILPPPPKFYNHHNHTMYSMNDSISKVSAVVERSKQLGMDSVTVTDHGTLGATFELWTECKKNNLKPVLGLEGYYVDDLNAPESQVDWNYAHIILLAKNEEGWKNLKKIQLKAWEVGHKRKPRFDFNILKEYGKGLICTTACIGGLVGWNLLQKDLYFGEKEIKFRKQIIKDRMRRFTDLFQKDFYMEIHYNEIPNQQVVNAYILKLSEKYNVQLIAANDCHYINKADIKVHDIMIAHSRKKTLDDPENGAYSRHTKQLWMKDYERIKNDYEKHHDDYISKEKFDESIRSTQEIVAKVEHFPIKPNMVCLPKFPGDNHQLMVEAVKVGWDTKLTPEQRESPVYINRLNYELSVFKKIEMEAYMLVCADIVKEAKKAGILYGPGRGSVCGSLVAYCMDISQIDPIRFSTLFDRFLNSSRISLPDIDMDFAKSGREKIKEIVAQKYGEKNFAAIVAYGGWKPRGVIKDIGKVLGRSYGEMDIITKQIHHKTSKFKDEEFPIPEAVQKWLDENPEIYEPAKKLEGLYRQRGVHASGMILTPTPLEDWLPISFMTDKDSSEKKVVKVTEWDMYDSEDAQILKIDFLGLNTLDVISETCKKINLDPYALYDKCLANLEDQDVYEPIRQGHTLGIFQLESSEGMLDLVKKMQPNKFHDIIMIISLYRTAIIMAGMLDEYLKRRNGEEFEYVHPIVEPVFKDTYGIMVFQEQLMNVAVVAAGFTTLEADNFRKATKLKDPEKFKPFKDQFVNGCKKNGLTTEQADTIWGWCYKFSGYGFNISHAAAYALITYMTMYLKHYHPVEFMTSLMTCNTEEKEKMDRYLRECRRMKIKVRQPDINLSTQVFKYLDKSKKILYPFTIVKQIGEKALAAIIDERKANGKYKSFENFNARVNKRVVNVGVMINLILSGAFNKVEGKKAEEIYDEFMESRKKEKTYRQYYCEDCKERFVATVKHGETNSIVCMSCGSDVQFELEKCRGKKFNKMNLTDTVYGYESSDEDILKKYVNLISKNKCDPLSTLQEMDEDQLLKTAVCVKKVKRHIDKKNNEMAFLDVSDGTMECSIVVFSNDWAKIEKEVKPGYCYIVKGTKNRGGLLFAGRAKQNFMLLGN